MNNTASKQIHSHSNYKIRSSKFAEREAERERRITIHLFNANNLHYKIIGENG